MDKLSVKIAGEIALSDTPGGTMKKWREKKIYGYTLIDSIKVILEMPYSDFPKLYGQTSERAFIFTEVSTGRSPMVVLRVTPMKPRIVVLHGIQAVDNLAIKIAQKERIPLLTTKLDL